MVQLRAGSAQGVEGLQQVLSASFISLFSSYHRLPKYLCTNSDHKSLLILSSFQGWVFNVVPWLVAIPTSLFSGFLSDHLISQGESSLWLFLSS